MNMKNTAILLIFLLSVTGLIIGVCLTEGTESTSFQNHDSDAVTVEENSIATIALADGEDNVHADIFITP